MSVIEHVRNLDYVRKDRVSIYGVSLGGNLALFLAAGAPWLHAVVVGAPAPIWFLGREIPDDGSRIDYDAFEVDRSVLKAHVDPIRAPILVQIGTEDFLLELNKKLHAVLAGRRKAIRMEIYEHGYHDFVLGNQGQERPDLPHGEILLQGALDALDRSVEFVKSGKLPED